MTTPSSCEGEIPAGMRMAQTCCSLDADSFFCDKADEEEKVTGSKPRGGR